MKGKGGYGGVILVDSFSSRSKCHLACSARIAQGGVAQGVNQK